MTSDFKYNPTHYIDTVYVNVLRKLIVQWLKKDFLGYLNEWEKSVADIEGLPLIQKKMRLLSIETITGLKISGICYISIYI